MAPESRLSFLPPGPEVWNPELELALLREQERLVLVNDEGPLLSLAEEDREEALVRRGSDEEEGIGQPSLDIVYLMTTNAGDRGLVG